MNQLSKEAIEAIEEIANRVTKERIQNEEDFTEFADPNQKLDAAYVHDFVNVVSESLTNPEIYEKAGLISLEDAMGFAEWTSANDMMLSMIDCTWLVNKKWITTTQLFTLFKEVKPNRNEHNT